MKVGKPQSSMTSSSWEEWLDAMHAKLSSTNEFSLHPLANAINRTSDHDESMLHEGPGPWDRQSVRVRISPQTYNDWLQGNTSTGECISDSPTLEGRELVLFSGNDYLGLSCHPLVRESAAKAAITFGMGPRGSAASCGYTYHHRLLETAIAKLKMTEECLLCPTGFSANTAVMSALSTSFNNDKIAIFSDALNHASIVDGIRASRKNADVYVYKHSDMADLEKLLLACKLDRKVVVTDSLFSVDGDFAELTKLASLRNKYKFILVVDDAHGTLACGENGGGVAESCNAESDIDIYVGTLSKAFGCHGGFIATSQKWKQLIQSRGRAFLFSTASPIPVVAAAYAALLVASKEKWRRQALWSRVDQLSRLTGLKLKSYIFVIFIGDAETTVAASKHLLEAGFHVMPITPPIVAQNASRLRISLSASHSPEDIEALHRAILKLNLPKNE